MEGRESIWVGKQRSCLANRAHEERPAAGWRVPARVPQGSCTTYVWARAMSTPWSCAATPPRGAFFGRIAGARGPFSGHRSVHGAGLCAVRRAIVSAQVALAHFCLSRSPPWPLSGSECRPAGRAGVLWGIGRGALLANRTAHKLPSDKRRAYDPPNRIRRPTPRSWLAISKEVPGPDASTSDPSMPSSGKVMPKRDST